MGEHEEGVALFVIAVDGVDTAAFDLRAATAPAERGKPTQVPPNDVRIAMAPEVEASDRLRVKQSERRLEVTELVGMVDPAFDAGAGPRPLPQIVNREPGPADV